MSVLVEIVKQTVPYIIGIFKKATVIGNILDSKGNPLSNIIINIGNKQDTSASDGSFVIDELSKGAYSISLKNNDIDFQNVKRIHVENGEKIEIKIAFPDEIHDDATEKKSIDAKATAIKTAGEFWNQFLVTIRGQSNFFQNNIGSNSHYLKSNFGINKVKYCIQARMDLQNDKNFQCQLQIESSKIANKLYGCKDEIEGKVGEIWQWRFNKKDGEIDSLTIQADHEPTDKSNWPKINDWFIEHIKLMNDTLRPYMEN